MINFCLNGCTSMQQDNESPVVESKTRAKSVFIAGVVSTFGLLFILTTRDPGSGGPVLIILFLLLLFIALCSGTILFIEYILKFLGAKSFSWVRLLYTSVALVSGLVFLVGLQTLRQLQLVDIILVLVFELVLNFYLLRRF